MRTPKQWFALIAQSSSRFLSIDHVTPIICDIQKESFDEGFRSGLQTASDSFKTEMDRMLMKIESVNLAITTSSHEVAREKRRELQRYQNHILSLVPPKKEKT